MGKKIAIVTSTLRAGGAERNSINLALYLPKSTYSTDILSILSINEYRKEYGKILQNIRIRYLLDDKRLSLSLPRLFLLPFAFIKLLLTSQKNKYSLLIAAHEYNTFYITVFAAKLLRIKSLLVLGNNIPANFASKSILTRTFHKLFLRISLLLCDKVVCVSKGIYDQMEYDFPFLKNKIELIYNGTHIIEIKKTSPQKTHAKNASKSLIAVGRLIKRKGFEHVIRVVKYLNEKERLDLHLIIVGKGDQAEELVHLSENLSIQNNISMVGMGGDKLLDYLGSADIFVFPSHYEGFGNTIIEAMSCKLPVISADCMFGPREILDDNSSYEKIIRRMHKAKYGILTPRLSDMNLEYGRLNASEKEMAQAIKEMVTNKNIYEYYRKKSFERAKYFSLKKMVDRYDSVINKML